MVKVAKGRSKGNNGSAHTADELEEHRDLAGALERVQGIGEDRAIMDDGAPGWTARYALEGALWFLAAFETAGLAVLSPGPSGVSEEVRVRWLCARGEALDRIAPLVDAAYLACCDVLRQSSTARAQLLALDTIGRAAKEIRWRVAALAPEVEVALAASLSPWDAPLAFRDDVLRAFGAANEGRATISIRASGPGAPHGETIELSGHFERLAGGPMPALPAPVQRAFAGLASKARAQIAAQSRANMDGPGGATSGPGATWDELCDIALVLRRTGHPLAELVVFVEATRLAGIGPGAWLSKDGDAVRFKRLVALALRHVARGDDRDGARDLARNALRALGHSVEDFTNTERQERYRRAHQKADGKADGKAPKRKVRDARKARE